MSKEKPVRARIGQSWLLLAIFLGTLCSETARGGDPVEPRAVASRFRQPVALCVSSDGRTLFVANRRTGSLSVIDAKQAKVVAENDVGRGLADVALLNGDDHLLAVDQAGDSLLLIDVSGTPVRVVDRVAVSADPIRVAITPDGSGCIVASLGSRRLTFLDVSAERPPLLKVRGTVDLPFSPRNMVFVRGGSTLIAADAYGGKLAVIDPHRGVLKAVRSMPGHNIGGMAVTPDGESLVVAHLLFLPPTRTTYEDIHWGLFLNNDLRILKLDRVLAPESDADLLKQSEQVHLANPGSGSADPSSLIFDRDGHLIVTFAGIDEVRIGKESTSLPLRTRVGRRPTALALSPDSRTAYVVNSLDDTLSVIDVASGKRGENLSLGPCPDLTTAERGERLFFDARLSHDGWMTCHSCHTDGHTIGLNSDTLGDGDFGAPKRIPSLMGVSHTGPWGWTGAFAQLEEQVRQSIESTMEGPSPSATELADLVAYLRTLAPPSPATQGVEHAGVSRGQTVFARECSTCHAGPHYTSRGKYDVGLADEAGNRQFNPPSLRGVGRREPLLHDGRARTLEDVFKVHHHPDGLDLPKEEVADLITFLRTL